MYQRGPYRPVVESLILSVYPNSIFSHHWSAILAVDYRPLSRVLPLL